MKRLLFFIRHGQTTWNVEHRLPGQFPGIELTDTGQEQAKRLAQALSVLPLSAIISSPSDRAPETARYLVAGRSLSIQPEPDLMDIGLGHCSRKDRDVLTHSDAAVIAFLRHALMAPS